MDGDILYTNITNEIDHTEFTFYNSDEIRKISVKEITNPMTYNSVKQPIEGGLYDKKMGSSKSGDLCPTCNKLYQVFIYILIIGLSRTYWSY